MAKGSITLDVGTKYDGEGLKKLDQGLKNASNTVKKVGGSVQRVSQAFSGLGGEAGKAAGQISGEFASIAEGGVKMAAITLVIQGAVKGINMLFEYLNKTNEAVKKVEASFKDGLAKAVAKATEQIKKFGTTYQSALTKKDVKASITSVKNEEEVKRMELDRKDAQTIIKGVSKEIVDADYVKKIEAKKTSNAQQAVTDIQNKIAWTEKAIDVSKRNEEHTKNNWSTYNDASLRAGSRGDMVAQADYYNKARYSKAQNEKWIENTKTLQADLEKLKLEEIKAQEKYITQKKSADSAILAAEQKKLDAYEEIEAKLKQQQAKKLEAEANVLGAEAKEAKENQLNEIKAIDAEINQLQKAVDNAQNIRKSGVQEKQVDPWHQENLADRRANAEAQRKQTAADQLANRIFDKDGNYKKAANSQDMDSLLNMVHNGAVLDDKQMSGLTARRDELQKMAGFVNNKMTPAQKKELQKLNDLLKGEDAKKKLKEAQAEKDRKVKEMQEDASKRTADIKKIREKIEQLGL